MKDKQKKAPKQIDSFKFVLSSPIGYKPKGIGTLMQTDKVELISPALKNYIESFALGQLLQAASIKAAAMFRYIQGMQPEEQKLIEEEEEDDKEEFQDHQKAADTARMTFKSSDVPLTQCVDVFKELCVNGTAEVEGMTMNFMQWEAISDANKVEMFFQFVGVFITPSLN